MALVIASGHRTNLHEEPRRAEAALTHHWNCLKTASRDPQLPANVILRPLVDFYEASTKTGPSRQSDGVGRGLIHVDESDDAGVVIDGLA